MSEKYCDETDCGELAECRRWARESGHYAFVEVLDRWTRFSPRIRGELRRRWREKDEKQEK